ncbi:hypothetical protein KP509_02G104300 [Ceratopteris richardii]|uniref:Uncharacterized protein n=1 Tax=Ceratopteris richardii TaxID=49495 RepID=A0A8T2VCX1_CERRI|nr:hypothetical protein KP509_02G104300 [Ceratopteris richardii]
MRGELQSSCSQGFSATSATRGGYQEDCIIRRSSGILCQVTSHLCGTRPQTHYYSHQCEHVPRHRTTAHESAKGWRSSPSFLTSGRELTLLSYIYHFQGTSAYGTNSLPACTSTEHNRARSINFSPSHKVFQISLFPHFGEGIESFCFKLWRNIHAFMYCGICI